MLNYRNIYWIVGGLPKYKDNFYIKDVKKKILKAYIIGKNIPFFSKQLKGKIPYLESYNLKNAVKNVCNDIKKNKESKCTILLSPAAASYDQFKNFEDRGNQFKTLIKRKAKIFYHV